MILLCDESNVIISMTEEAIWQPEMKSYKVGPNWYVAEFAAVHYYEVSEIPAEVKEIEYCYDGMEYSKNPNYSEPIVEVNEPAPNPILVALASGINDI